MLAAVMFCVTSTREGLTLTCNLRATRTANCTTVGLKNPAASHTLTRGVFAPATFAASFMTSSKATLFAADIVTNAKPAVSKLAISVMSSASIGTAKRATVSVLPNGTITPPPPTEMFAAMSPGGVKSIVRPLLQRTLAPPAFTDCPAPQPTTVTEPSAAATTAEARSPTLIVTLFIAAAATDIPPSSKSTLILFRALTTGGTPNLKRVPMGNIVAPLKTITDGCGGLTRSNSPMPLSILNVAAMLTKAISVLALIITFQSPPFCLIVAAPAPAPVSTTTLPVMANSSLTPTLKLAAVMFNVLTVADEAPGSSPLMVMSSPVPTITAKLAPSPAPPAREMRCEYSRRTASKKCARGSKPRAAEPREGAGSPKVCA